MPHTLTRRAFLGGTVATALTTITANREGRGQPPAEKAWDGDYFDVHIHLTQPWGGAIRGPLTVREVLRWMDSRRISQAAILPLVSPEAFWYPVTTDFVLTQTRPHRDRLVPFCAIDPRSLATHLPTKQDVVDLLGRYRDAGARGFGEHKPMLAIDDPLNMRLYEACQDVKLPVLFHLDNYANMDRPGLPGLARVLKTFPELIMIGHGKGWWASIAGGLTQADLHVGYPKGPVAPSGAIDKWMDQFPNLYGDLSSSGAHAILRDQEFGSEFLKRRSGRLLFGTDYYDLTQRDFKQFELLNQFPLPPAAKRRIARDNARRILQI